MYGETLLSQLSSNFLAYFIISPLLFAGIFLCRLRHRKHFTLRISLAIPCYCLMTFFLSPFYVSWQKILPWVFSFLTLTLLAFVCFDHSLYDILFCSIVGFALMNSLNLVVQGINMFLNLKDGLWFVLFVPVQLLSALLSYLFLARRFIVKNKDILMDNILVLFVSIVLLFAITGYLNNLGSEILKDEIMAILFRLLLNCTIILLMISYRKNKTLMDEREVLEHVIERDNDNFRNMREYMRIIDMKCHDFKALEGIHDRPGKLSEELSSSIDAYRNTPKTGNEALDVVLYDKILLCREKQIQLTYIVDGESLKKMHSVDVASMFNNLLANAMEYVSTLEDEKKRLISMNVYRKYDFLYIQVENYIEKKVELVDGFPPTTKKKSQLHGLGLKSVDYIAKKYKGAFKIEQDEHLFSANVVIPLSGNEK